MISDGSLKSLMLLWQSVCLEEAAQCRISTREDCKTVFSRCQSEGVSFLAISLPAFGKDFERSLELGRIDRNLFQGFSWKGGLPRFLSGFLGLIFDSKTGELHKIPSVDSIRAVRQLTLMFGKINLECSEERQRRAYEGYLACEQSVQECDARLVQADYLDFHRVSRLIWSRALSRCDTRVYSGEHVPRHGPGSTADGLRGNAKYEQSVWTERLETAFPASEFLFASRSNYLEALEEGSLTWLEPGQELPVSVITVPKTPKTPRIIAMEPTCMMYAQQSIKEILYEELEKGDARSNFVGFEHQEPNQLLAQKGSLDGSLATLDLSEASDRVSVRLVEKMLEDHPHLSEAVFACRSTSALVQGEVIQLSKFASMGSALCFPVEAMVFTTVVFLGIERVLNSRLTRDSIEQFRGQVRVYGDDIVVPSRFAVSVVETLEYFGFKVNTSKSFWNSKFRESCGKEFYAGEDVSIVRCRAEIPESRKNVERLASWVAMRNQFYKTGLWQTAFLLDSIIEKVIPFPVVGEESPVLGRHSFLGYEVQRMSPHTHAPQVKGWRVKANIPINKIDGYAALLKCLLKRGGDPFMDDEHLERSGRPVRVDMTYGWASSF